MHQFKGSPVVGYKIAIVNNADLHNQNKVITPAVFNDDGEMIEAARTQQQFVWASKRLMRAVRKARAMIGSHKHIQLFGMKKDGTHFPVSLKIRKTAPAVEQPSHTASRVASRLNEKNAQGETLGEILVDKIREDLARMDWKEIPA
jgi:hypothetical protein